MSAPEAVVRAVMKRLGCVRDVDCNGHHYCLAHYYGWLHDADTCPHAEAGADAAYAATLAVLRDLIRADGPEGDAARGALGLEWHEDRDRCQSEAVQVHRRLVSEWEDAPCSE